MHSSQFRRRIKGSITVTAAVLLITVITLVLTLAPGQHPKSSAAKPKLAPPSASPPQPTEAALTGPLQVIEGSQLINGVYLGYPHSTQGAVSAADEFMADIGSTLDPDGAAAVLRLTADPTWQQAPALAAQGTATDRQHLGLPPSGPLPAGVEVQLEPVEYQVLDLTPDQVTVLLLADYITTLPGQGTQTSIGVYPLQMGWADSDWKIFPPSTVSYSSLAAEPGSPQAASDGWQELTP
jgi:hypothetical protein